MAIESIDGILRRLHTSRAALLDAAAQVSGDRWKSPPGPGRWSAGDVIAHLTMVEERITGGTAQLLEQPPRPVPLSKRLHVPIIVVRWRLFRARTPIPLDGSLVGEKEAMLERLGEARRKTLALLEQNRGRDLAAYRWPHPLLGSLNTYDWFRLMAHHEVRHTKQIREIIRIFQN